MNNIPDPFRVRCDLCDILFLTLEDAKVHDVLELNKHRSILEKLYETRKAHDVKRNKPVNISPPIPLSEGKGKRGKRIQRIKRNR